MRATISGLAVAALLATTPWTTPGAEAGTVTPIFGGEPPQLIFGGGNSNRGFTVIRDGSLEIGLRAKRRYTAGCAEANGCPNDALGDGIVWDGTDTYTFDPADGAPPPDRAMWNFTYSINTDWDGNGGTLADYLFTLRVAGPGIVGGFFDYNPLLAPGYFGTNATDTQVLETTLAKDDLGHYSLVQQSVNLGFFLPFDLVEDVQATGQFTITLFADPTDSDKLLSFGQITVNVIPLPGALPLMAGGLGLLGFMGWRRKRAAA